METLEQRVMPKVFRRLIPFLILCYFVSFLDRVNVGFAALQMNKDLGLSATAFGLGAGLFFLTYFLFEVPSNLLLVRFGARRWIARIMVTWGLVSAATAFVTGPTGFYIVRLLLGLAEAGFFPGVAYFLTLWFPSAYRARVMGCLLVAAPMSTVIGAPISGALLNLEGVMGLHGWQWMFILEAVPAVILGFIALKHLKGEPADADWLSADERNWLSQRMAAEERERRAESHLSVAQVFFNPQVWLLSTMAFGFFLTIFGVGFFLPQIVKSFGLSNVQTGFVAAIPYVIASLSIVFWARRSDARKERRLHIAVPAFIAGVALIAAALVDDSLLKMVAFSVAAFGIFGALPAFWAINTTLLSGPASAAGIAFIGAVGNLGGFAGPSLLGLSKDMTGSYAGGLVILAAVAFVAAAIAPGVGRRSSPAGIALTPSGK